MKTLTNKIIVIRFSANKWVTNPMFNIIEYTKEGDNVTSLFQDGTVAYNNREIEIAVNSYLDVVPPKVLKEWRAASAAH